MSSLTDVKGVSDCCKQDSNLEDAPPVGEIRVRVCKVCGRRHFEVDAEPGEVGVRIA